MDGVDGENGIIVLFTVMYARWCMIFVVGTTAPHQQNQIPKTSEGMNLDMRITLIGRVWKTVIQLYFMWRERILVGNFACFRRGFDYPAWNPSLLCQIAFPIDWFLMHSFHSNISLRNQSMLALRGGWSTTQVVYWWYCTNRLSLLNMTNQRWKVMPCCQCLEVNLSVV